MRIVHTHTYTHTLTHVGSHCISVIYAPWPGSLMLHQMNRSNDWPSLSKRMLPYFFLSKRCSQRCHYGVLVLWLLYSSFGVSLLRQKKKKKLRRVSSSTFGVKLSLQPSNFRIIFFHHRHIQYKLQQQHDISQLSCFFFWQNHAVYAACVLGVTFQDTWRLGHVSWREAELNEQVVERNPSFQLLPRKQRQGLLVQIARLRASHLSFAQWASLAESVPFILVERLVVGAST